MEYYNKFKINSDIIINDNNIYVKNNEKKNEINNDSLEINNSNDIEKEEINNINNTNTEIKNEKKEGIESNLIKEYKTFKEQRNAVNNRNRNNNLK